MKLGLPILSSPFDLFLPIHTAWWAIFGVPMTAGLVWLTKGMAGNPLTDGIGPFGIAIILLTIAIKVITSSLFQYQIPTSRPMQADQRRIAPELPALRKKYMKNPKKHNRNEMGLH